MALYTSTEGRISRKQWWLGMLGLLVAGMVLSLLSSLLGFTMWVGVPELGPDPDPAAIAAAVAEIVRRSAWVSLVMFLILAYPAYCVSVKRRHDRDHSGVDVLAILALNALMLVLQGLGFGMSAVEMGEGVVLPTPAPWLSVVSLAMGLFGLYLLVQLGFLKGTPGPNRFGEDPLRPAGMD